MHSIFASMPVFVIILIKPVRQTLGNVPSAMQRAYTVNIDSADVSHAALIFCFLLLSEAKKNVCYVFQLRPKLDYTYNYKLVLSF
jgi:hypothetical protein